MTIFCDMKGHMITDGYIQELHIFADAMDLRREWFQDHPRHPHYDLVYEKEAGRFVPCKSKIMQAFDLGAKVVTSKRIVEISRGRLGKEHPQAETQIEA